MVIEQSRARVDVSRWTELLDPQDLCRLTEIVPVMGFHRTATFVTGDGGKRRPL
jgi:hypothetical protein